MSLDWMRGWRVGLGWKLFAAFAVVILVGVGTLWIAVELTAPGVFAQDMAAMMGGSAPMMMDGAAETISLTRLFEDALQQALLLATAAAVLTAVAASAFVTVQVVGPVRRMAVASRRLAAGRYAERVPVASGDELGELARAFNQLAAALEATERRRLELIGDVSHELRTPIATLEGYLEGLLDGVVEPNEATWARLHDEAGRLRRLVDDLQELSRAEARQIPLQARAVDPAEIARVALERASGLFEDAGLRLEVTIPKSLPRVLADADRASQVLTNLLTNAVRYTPAPGEVRLQLEAQPRAVAFRVSDTGQGIAPEHLPHLFERFYRVDRSRSRASGGSGIGLTIARALVEAMGGEIRAESPGPGQGACFSFTLPRAP